MACCVRIVTNWSRCASSRLEFLATDPLSCQPEKAKTRDTVEYNGFLSYSHAVDGNLAPAVQSALHRFARPWYRLRSVWIFRDKTGLAVTPSLWETIEKALADSEYFLLMGISGSGRLALGPERGRLVARQLLSEQHAYPVDGWRDRVLSPGPRLPIRQGSKRLAFAKRDLVFLIAHARKWLFGFSGCRRGCWIGRRRV
jgi:hypothetical protein